MGNHPTKGGKVTIKMKLFPVCTTLGLFILRISSFQLQAQNMNVVIANSIGNGLPDDSSCIYLSGSSNAGESWSDPVRVSEQKGNAQGGNYSTHGSYNTTGPNGEVYVAWFGPSGLMFDRSTDQGNTWLTEDINTAGAHIDWIYSIPGVNLGVTFPFIACDRSGGPYNGNIYMAVSEDGGNTFQNFKVSETPFTPYSSVFFGHYLGVTAYDDHVYSVWNRMDNGENSLVCAIVDPTIIGKKENYPGTPKAQLVNYPNPFAESSFVSFRINEPSDVTLQLFDITGKLISTLINAQAFSRGKYVRKIDTKLLRLVPWVYILKLSTEKEQIATRALVVEKQ
jgi:hypothetical protein